jgi:hypothetical protein
LGLFNAYSQLSKSRRTAMSGWLQAPQPMRRRPSSLVIPAIISWIAAGILFVGIHIFTVYLAWTHSILQMLLTLIVPVGAQLYWLVHTWYLTGRFLNLLTGLCLIWLVVFVSALVLHFATRETG